MSELNSDVVSLLNTLGDELDTRFNSLVKEDEAPVGFVLVAVVRADLADGFVVSNMPKVIAQLVLKESSEKLAVNIVLK